MLTILWTLILAVAIGQAPTTTITGQIVDGAGRVVPGVGISTKSSAPLRLQVDVVSASDGRFVFRTLPPGSYILTATLNGFRMQQKRVDVKAGETKTVDFTMRVGCLPGSLAVSDEEPTVDSGPQAPSDLVAHLRIDDRIEEDHPSNPSCRTRYRATVLRTVQRPSFSGSVDGTIEVVFNRYPDIELDHEYVAGLRWRVDENAFEGGPSVADAVRLVDRGRVKIATGLCASSVQSNLLNHCVDSYFVGELFRFFSGQLR